MFAIRLLVLTAALVTGLLVATNAVAGNGNGNVGLPPVCLEDTALQDPFLEALRIERVPVSIFLVNGIKLQGTIEDFDSSVILLKNSVSQMVYKHAVSTIVPARNVSE